MNISTYSFSYYRFEPSPLQSKIKKYQAKSNCIKDTIYIDEAIVGIKTVKRDGFLKMIKDCMAGMVALILTKFISKFSRNLVDAFQYVRMFKGKVIAFIETSRSDGLQGLYRL